MKIQISILLGFVLIDQFKAAPCDNPGDAANYSSKYLDVKKGEECKHWTKFGALQGRSFSAAPPASPYQLLDFAGSNALIMRNVKDPYNF